MQETEGVQRRDGARGLPILDLAGLELPTPSPSRARGHHPGPNPTVCYRGVTR